MTKRNWRTGFVVLAFVVSSCAHGAAEVAASPEAGWAAWRSGDASLALQIGDQLAESTQTAPEGRHIATLAAHARGEYEAAVAYFEGIPLDYPRRREARGAAFESLMHLNRGAEALAFATATEMSANARARAQMLADNPISVSLPGIVALGFEQDALTPYMPGIAGQVNGRAAVFRFDTGGTFVAMSPALATRYGVRSAQCAHGFANLQAAQVCHGVADISLGAVRIANAPVVVVSSLPNEQLGVELGPVLGTNFLQRFHSTIDAPRGRLILSPRGDAAATAQHTALVGSRAIEVPFLLWSDHFILARGGAGERDDLTFFVDSGLVAVADDGVQAGLLVSQSEAAAWAAISDPAAVGQIVPVSPRISLGGVARSSQRAMVLPDAAWASFGNFGGIAVNGLISFGFLKHYSWTLDFDRHVILLHVVD